MASLSVQKLFSVANKTVLVTGGGRGIGKMIAEGFVSNGSTVYISSRDAAALGDTASELSAAGLATGMGGSCIAVPANLSTRAGCEDLAAALVELVPPEQGLHCLVNNSGASWGEPLSRKSGKLNWGWDRVLDLNVKAPFYLTRALLPLLWKSSAVAQEPSRVIMIGSVVGERAQDFPTHAYDASKAALHSLTKKLAYDLAKPYNPEVDGELPGPTYPGGRMTVNAIAPGYVATKMSDGLAAWGVTTENTAAKTPLGRMGLATDMAGAALYLASPAGAWTSGVVLPVDGGILSTPLSLGVVEPN